MEQWMEQGNKQGKGEEMTNEKPQSREKKAEFPKRFSFGQSKEIKGGQRREVSFVLEHPPSMVSQQMWYRVCVPGQELEMLAVNKGKALLHLVFLSIIDPCSSHRSQVGRRGKAACPAAKGQPRAGSVWVLSSSMLLLSA